MRTYLKALNVRNPCEVCSVACVFKIKSITSIISHVIYGAVRIMSAYFFLMMMVRIRVLHLVIIIKWNYDGFVIV